MCVEVMPSLSKFAKKNSFGFGTLCSQLGIFRSMPHNMLLAMPSLVSTNYTKSIDAFNDDYTNYYDSIST